MREKDGIRGKKKRGGSKRKDVVWLPNFCFDDVWIESVCTRYDYWLLKGSMYFISTMLSGKCIQETMLLIIEGYKIKMKRK